MGSPLIAIIGGWQIVGGLYGLGFLVYAIATAEGEVDTVVPTILFGVLYALSVVAGTLVLRGQRLGRPTSIVVQALQVPVLQWRGLGFILIGGVGPRFRLDVDLALFGGLDPTAFWVPAPQVAAQGWATGLNLVGLAAVVILSLARYRAARPAEPIYDQGPPNTRDISAAFEGALSFDTDAKEKGPDVPT